MVNFEGIPDMLKQVIPGMNRERDEDRERRYNKRHDEDEDRERRYDKLGLWTKENILRDCLARIKRA